MEEYQPMGFRETHGLVLFLAPFTDKSRGTRCPVRLRPAPVILNDRSGEVRLGVQRVQKHGVNIPGVRFLGVPVVLTHTRMHVLLEFSPLASACICTCACVCVRVLVYVYV